MSIRNIIFVLVATFGWSSVSFGYSELNQPDDQTTGELCVGCAARRALLEEFPRASRERRREIVIKLTELNGGKVPDLPSAESAK